MNRACEVLWAASAQSGKQPLPFPMTSGLALWRQLRSTHIGKNHFDMKVHIYAFIMLMLNDANKINTF